jgi:hypothetical protein
LRIMEKRMRHNRVADALTNLKVHVQKHPIRQA